MLRCLQNCVLFLLIFLQMDPQEAKGSGIVEYTNISLKVFDWKLVQSINTFLYGTNVFYTDFTLNSQVNKFDLKLKFDWIKADNRLLNIFSVNLDGCKSLQGTKQSKFIRAIFNELARSSNLPKKCPILSDKMYVIKNFTFKAGDFRVLAHNIQWQVTLDFVINQKLTATFMLSGRVRKN